MAVDQISTGAPRRWLLVQREAGIPDRENGHDRWSVNRLFLDHDAIPTRSVSRFQARAVGIREGDGQFLEAMRDVVEQLQEA